VAAFLTGAIIQRTWLARFAIKFPFVELSDLNEAAAASADAITQGIKEIREYVDDQIKTVVGKVDENIEDLKETASASASGITTLRENLDRQIKIVADRVEKELERRK
jgi:archaellum component FlaC